MDPPKRELNVKLCKCTTERIAIDESCGKSFRKRSMMTDAGGEAGSANINGTQGGDPGGVWRLLEFSQEEASRCV